MEKGVRIDNTYMGNTIQYDPTNPEAREYVWNKAKQNYYDKGVKIFWLDEAEPEYTVYDFENYRYHLGPNVQIGNIYPAMYAQTFFEGMKKEGRRILSICCAVHGQEARDTEHWYGQEISIPPLRAFRTSSQQGLIWESRGFRGGQRISEDFSEQTSTTRTSMRC